MLTYIKNKFKNTPDYVYTIGSILAAAQINYVIVHSAFVYIVLLVMLTHELAHYFFGKFYKGKSKLPIFLPLPFFVIAVTKVTKLGRRGRKNTALAGPVVGTLTTGLIILFNYIFNFMSYIPLVALGISEIVANYFGSDGAKYRKAKKEIKLCTF